MAVKRIDDKVISDSVKYSVDKITEIVKKVGPRESGSKEAKEAQKILEKELEKFADEIHYESYEMAPKAFLHFTKGVSTAVGASILGAGAIKYGLKPKSKAGKTLPHALIAGVDLVSLGITAGEFLFYRELLDKFYPKADGSNMIAVRKAKGETKKRIIISGHIDTAYEWRHIYYGKGKLMGPFMGTSIVTAIISAVLSSTSAVLSASGKKSKIADFITDAAFPVHALTLIGLFLLNRFINFSILSPGANDNLTGTLAAVCALKMLDEMDLKFENTEVVCMITDGEEAGLRGAKAYAKAHHDELTDPNVETVVLCVDTLTDLKDLNVYNKDMTGTVKLDQELCSIVREAAAEMGHDNLKYANVFFGSSDAAAYAQAGIRAATLAAMDPAPADYYHNRRDSYDRLVPETIKTGYEIILNTIIKFAGEDND